jgi:hypothetical protein
MMAGKLTLNINLSNMAVTQFCDYDYNSFCKIGNILGLARMVSLS